jgi:hypothetical protein
VILNQGETKADVSGWVTIDNYSGKRYDNAKLKLIAGDVNTVQPPQPEILFKNQEIMVPGAPV